jgi:phage terminase large subunit-like protein
MQLESDRFAWDGSQVPLLGFDQLEHFHESQFWYLFSRNRSTCGIAPYIRATCNPVLADDEVGGWLHRLVQWWIDPETGYPIKERSGVIRWMLRVQEEVVWGEDRSELIDRYSGSIPEEDLLPKSFTFIPGTLADNPALTSKDPGYRASLLAMPYVERERLLGGNWNVRPEAGKVFNRSWFRLLNARPRQLTALIRYWDKAATEAGGAYTSGGLMGRLQNGQFVLLDITRGQWSSKNRETVIQQTAAGDSLFAKEVNAPIETWLEQEPGSGGKESAESSVINLAGYVVKTERVTGSKLTRSGPYSAQCEAGNVFLVNPLGAAIGDLAALESYLREAQNFDGVTGRMDQIDCSSGAFNKLVLMKGTILHGKVTW